MDEWINGKTYKWIDGWMDELMDGCGKVFEKMNDTVKEAVILVTQNKI